MTEELNQLQTDRKVTTEFVIPKSDWSPKQYTTQSMLEELMMDPEIPCPVCHDSIEAIEEDNQDDRMLVFYQGQLICNVCGYVHIKNPQFKISLEIQEDHA